MSRLQITPVDPASRGLLVEVVGEVQDTGGIGGWSSVDRPMRTAAAEWIGLPERIQTVPIALDGRAGVPSQTRDVESECRLLESWGQPTRQTGEPPVLRIAGIAVYGTSRRWVIDDLVKGQMIFNEAGRRISMDYTLVLREYHAPVVLRSPAKKARQKRAATRSDTD